MPVRHLLALPLLLLAACSAPSTPPSTPPAAESRAGTPVSLEVITGKGTQRFDVATLIQKIAPVEFRLFNPEFGREIAYKGVPLIEVLRLAGLELEGRKGDLLFRSVDGYSPTRDLVLIGTLDLMVAYEEIGGWSPVPGKEQFTGAPFYVLSRRSETFDAFPWPWAVVSIELVDFTERFASLLPSGAEEGSAEMKGFRRFRENCLSCHSLNLLGGSVGPELNIPMNITEYHDVQHLARFIRNPTSFRARTGMPGFPQFSEEEVGEILTYLSSMKENKVEVPGSQTARE